MHGNLYHRKDIEKRFHITRRIIENYEKLGLIKHNNKDKMGYYLYDEETIKRIGQIRLLQLLGLSLVEVKEIVYRKDNKYEKEVIMERINYLKEQPKRINKLIKAANLYLENKNDFLEKEIIKSIYKQ